MTKWIVGGVGIGIVVLLSAPALANFQKTYNAGAICRPFSAADAAHLTFDQTAGTVRSSATGMRIACGINKYTSGPYISSGDAISTVQVPISNGKGTSISCRFRIYQNEVTEQATDNLWVDIGPTSRTSQLLTFQEGTFSGYWFDRSIWWYPMLECTLNGGQTLGSYTVTEAGSLQQSHIMSPAACMKVVTTKVPEYGASGSDGSGPGGFFENPGQEPADFEWSCPAAGSVAQFAMTPSLNPGGFGWDFVQSPPGGFVAAAGSFEQDMEFQTIWVGGPDLWPGLQVPANELVWNGINDYWLTTAQTHTVFFKDLSDNGDGDFKMFGYRTLGDSTN